MTLDELKTKVTTKYPVEAAEDRLRLTLEDDFVPAPNAIGNYCYQDGWNAGWRWACEVATVRQLADLEGNPLAALPHLVGMNIDYQLGHIHGATEAWQGIKDKILPVIMLAPPIKE